MKLSFSQFREAFKYAFQKKAKPTKLNLSHEELQLLKEMVKQMPERAVRHFNYKKIKEESGKVSAEDVAEKVLLRSLVDRLFWRVGKGNDKSRKRKGSGQ